MSDDNEIMLNSESADRFREQQPVAYRVCCHLLEGRLRTDRAYWQASVEMREVLDTTDAFHLDVLDYVADFLGVPPDLTVAVPYDLLCEWNGDVFCRDWLIDMAGSELGHESDSELVEKAHCVIGHMLRVASVGDTTTCDEAQEYITKTLGWGQLPVTQAETSIRLGRPAVQLVHERFREEKT